MSNIPFIECSPDGPYLVKNLPDLRSSNGQSLSSQPVIALCRCGGSSNKPFCDGTHGRIGFSGARLASDIAAQRVDYRAAGITIHDDRSLCAHAGYCTEGLASVFKYGSEPWIEPTGASVTAIIEIIRRCPSGALTYTLDTPEEPQARMQPSVVVSKDGPYAVAGGITLSDSTTGQICTNTQYTLCRCGGSKNKPFCDGTHWAIGFKDEQNGAA